MDFNQICINDCPIYVLSVNQLSAKSKLLNAFKKASTPFIDYSYNMHSKQMILHKILGTQTIRI